LLHGANREATAPDAWSASRIRPFYLDRFCC
jgi:hypothetical protein